MNLIMPPRPGEDVSILASHSRFRGQVTRRGPESLTIELEQTPARQALHFAAGALVSVEWVHALGLMQVTAKVKDAQAEPRPALRLEVVGTPEPVERREYRRAPVELSITAWTLAQPTRRLEGKTVDLSLGGALLSIPELSSFARKVELTIGLPGGPMQVSARVAWRREPSLLGVEFGWLKPEEETRLVEFLRGFG
jgi:PilZ domain